MPFRSLVVLACLFSLGSLASSAHASWPSDPNLGGVPLAIASSTQSNSRSISDGAGGAIVVWEDLRNSITYDIYVQRIDATGTPRWTANGVLVCGAGGDQTRASICSDGNGGAIITWEDTRTSPAPDIYAQRVDATGAVRWTANGVAVCNATGPQSTPRCVADLSGGAIVAWEDSRVAPGDIFGQRLSSTGVGLWTANGSAICNATNLQVTPVIVPDGFGGAIVGWRDFRSGLTFDLFAQRVNAAGTGLWAANGAVVCAATDDQSELAVLPDGNGGAFFVWQDFRNSTHFDGYHQHLTATGSPAYASGGITFVSATGDQTVPAITSDGAGGMIIAWTDTRSGTNEDIYAQRVNSAGANVWPLNGVAISATTGNQRTPRTVSDGSGGAIISWTDERNPPSNDLYAQRVNSFGNVIWTFNGTPVSTAANDQLPSTSLSDGNGGAILTWTETRNGTPDIYAQRIEHFGQLGEPEPHGLQVSDVKNDQGGAVKLAWDASYLDDEPAFTIFDYRVWRSVPASATSLARPVLSDPDAAFETGALFAGPLATSEYAWEPVGTVSAATLPRYSLVTTTTGDSVGGSNPYSVFMVEARAGSAVSAFRWFSAPDSGYSVDNLAPGTPFAFTGQYSAGMTTMSWHANPESDLSHYRIYRGTDTRFKPAADNLVGQPTTTSFVDAPGQGYFYKLSAVDIHGNESLFASLTPNGVLDAPDDPQPRALAFDMPQPNPARGRAAFHFALPLTAPVTLAVFDAAGRKVRVLVQGELHAGRHHAVWDLRDDAGRTVGAGLYFARLETQGQRLERRLIALH